MEFQQTGIAGVVVATPRVFEDGRGYFMETWREELLDQALGYPVRFVQDNESRSVRGVLRGLHYQRGAASQAKLVRVLQGEVYDVAVDLRVSSPTFGRYVGVRLSGENHRQLFVPRGFAHGFQVLSDVAVFAYKVDNRYAPETEASIRYDDPDLAIDWPLKEGLILSDKDLQRAVSFAQAEKFG
ncbi:MAG: dTDP-4-dehydrorhamnose 3,5-epimerase [Alloprevotella sp.]|nr:dTDP-4-dehydrorhamnose 3,5-epimerase [Alloprevotella sp.]